MTHTDQSHLVARVIAGGASSAAPLAYGKNARLGGLPDAAERLNADAMAVPGIIRDEIRATGKCTLPVARIAERANISAMGRDRSRGAGEAEMAEPARPGRPVRPVLSATSRLSELG
jgi:hypothetical protein